jgi:hypothetical protein
MKQRLGPANPQRVPPGATAQLRLPGNFASSSFNPLRSDENGVPASSALVARLPYVARVGLLAVIYFVLAKRSLLLAIPPGDATAVWPPSGIAVAVRRYIGVPFRFERGLT